MKKLYTRDYYLFQIAINKAFLKISVIQEIPVVLSQFLQISKIEFIM